VTPPNLLRKLFDAAIGAADPCLCVPPHLPTEPPGRTVVVGAGKAAAAMARAVETNWQGSLSGLVITRYGHRVDCDQIRIVEAGHPVPDSTGQHAAREILDRVRDLGAHDLVLCLISGGASSLLALPASGISLKDKQALTRELLVAGATIGEMNCVRKHLSAIKGGRLAQACHPATVRTLLISDVPGDHPTIIGSGPTVADPTTCADALDVLHRYGLKIPAAIERLLIDNTLESPKPGDGAFRHDTVQIIARPSQSLAAAAGLARTHGITAILLGDDLEGEARALAHEHAERARKYAGMLPCVLLSGGETTVTVSGAGRGGRNTEYLLALAIALDAAPNIYAIAADTDGIDGTESNAGAIIDPDILSRARTAGIDAERQLFNNDAYGFFAATDALVETGPTLTNVNDFRAILIEAK